jgi:3-oxoacyl-[acyl-carrier-protein] synthase III
MKAFIKAISYYLPEKLYTNTDLVRDFPEWTNDKILSKIGISCRHIAADDETAGDMAIKAAKTLFNEYNISPNEIDFLLLCTQSPDYYLPTTACIVQNKLGLPINSGALDFNLGCSGFVYGLALAKGLLASGISKNVLLITSETYTKHIHPADKGNRSIFGDAAAATLISTNGFAEIQNFSLGTDGRGAENLIVKAGGFRHVSKLNNMTPKCDNHEKSDYLYMNGSEILNFTLESVPPLVTDILLINGRIISEIDLFIFHQANKFMLDFLRKKLEIESSKFYFYLENVGNTVSSTIPIALKESYLDNKLKNDVLIAGFGVGYSSAGTILKINTP